MSTTLAVPECYGWIIVLAALACFEAIIASIFVMKARSKYFGKEFMEKHFGEDHKKIENSTLSKEGYPDMGSGRYSNKLSYEAWYFFNCA